MAKQAEPQTQPEPEGHPGKGSRKKVVVVALVTLLLLVGGGTGTWLLRSGGGERHEGKHKPVQSAPPVFVTLEPFVVNLAGDVERYVQLGIDLKVAEKTVPDRIKEHMPEIRNAVLLLLSAKTAEDLARLDGKHALRHEVRAAINTVLGIAAPTATPQQTQPAPAGSGEAQAALPAAVAPPPEVGSAQHTAASVDAGVLEVLFTSFVIQ